jgi:voltage-gated potassium channel
MPATYQNQLQRAARRLQHLFISAILIVLTLLIGMLGYILIENYDLLSAFYMTVITLATVGFGEVHPLSNAGRIFTALLIITNIGIFTYAISVLSSFLVEGNVHKIWKDFKTYRKMKTLQQHIIVCGYGRYGKEVCAQLIQHRTPFILIEENEKKIELLEQENQLLHLQGDATQDEVLKEAGITHARALVSTLPSDADNVYVTLTARQLNPQLRIICRAITENAEAKLRMAGANEVIQPERIGGFYMSTLINKPDVVSFFRLLSNEMAANISFEEIKLNTQGSNNIYNIRDLNIRGNTGVNIIGVKNTDGKFMINPSPDTELRDGMCLIILGDHQQLHDFKKFWQKQTKGDFEFLE